MLKFMSYSDDGHGWLRVPKYLVQDLLGLEKISAYSYENNGWLYLEEDNDAGIFIAKLNELNHQFSVKHSRKNGQSHIRNYSRILQNECKFCRGTKLSQVDNKHCVYCK